MVNQIQVTSKIANSRAKILAEQLRQFAFGKEIKRLYLVDVYTIDKRFKREELEKIGLMLTNPVTENFAVNKEISPPKFSWVVEIGFLPGVTDNVATTVKEEIEDLLKVKFSLSEGVYTSQRIFIEGKLKFKEVKALAGNLINPLIQRLEIKNYSQFKKDGGMTKIVPKVRLSKEIRVDEVDILGADDNLLTKIGREGIANPDGSSRGPLALDLTYMRAIKKYFQKEGRNPTDIEIESIAQTWSEHCKHTIFNDPIDEIKRGLFKTYIKGATEKIRKKKGRKDFCVSVFTDNSGAIALDENWLVTAKVETHNSPSALDPFGGAITGIVGVNRDAIGFGLGAKPICNLYGFCFASPWREEEIYRDEKLTQKMLSPRRIMEGVIRGVNVGGNCSGIPTPQGFLYFDESYRGKPLVFVGTLGLIPRRVGNKPSFLKRARPGDYIVMVGGRVGIDGIHGATFSSEALNVGSPVGAVQIGDPITQKKLSDAIVKEARDLDLYHSITDNGAGGLSCSVAEMAKECGGFEVELEKVPLKYPGLDPWQIWISESQERMTLAVPPPKWEKFLNLMTRRGVEATIIGKFTNSGKAIVKYKGKKIMDLEMNFLHDGLPPRPMKTSYSPKFYPEPIIPRLKNLNKTLLKMLSWQNIASFEFVSQQYDHEVRGGSVIKPLIGRGRINSETTVICPVLGLKRGIAVSQALYPRYGLISPYWMAACAIDTAIRNIIAVGGALEKIALLDNFCWCSSNEPERLAQLKQAVKACWDFALAYETPFISGKDSMFNDFKGYDKRGRPIKISVLPTLLITSLGIVENIFKLVSPEVKFPGDLIYILGETFEQLGGTEYFALFGSVGGNVPTVNAEKNKKIYRILTKTIKKGLVASCISLNRGGLGVALAKMAMGGKLGVEISLKNLPGGSTREDFALFSESQGRFLVTVAPQNKNEFEKTLRRIPWAKIGKVISQKRIIVESKDKKEIINLDLEKALKAYKSTFKNF